MYGPGHRLFRRSWQYFYNLLALARLVGQAGELPFGLPEQAVERLLQRALCRVERRRLALKPGAVMLQPRLVQAVDRRDLLGPSPAPFRQADLAGRALDKIAPLMRPTERKGHQPPAKASEPLVGAIAVADDDRVEEGRREQLLRRFGAARRVDMEVDGIAADRGPQPGAARPVFPAKLLHAPAGFVRMAQRRLVLVREDRPGDWLEQWHEAEHAVGERPGRDRQPPVGQPRGDPLERAVAGIAFEQDAGPHADSVGRVAEQPRHRGRRHFDRRRRAAAGPAPARTADHTLVGLDVDLDERGDIGADRRIGLAATGAHTRLLRRVDLLLALLEPGPSGTAMAWGAALLAARASGARRLLLLALSAEQRLRQHRPGRAKPGKLRFQRLDPIPRRLRALAQPGVLPGQRFDRGLLAPRSPQRPAQFGIRNGQRLRQRLPDRSKPGKLGLKRLSDCTKFGRLNLQRRLPPLQLPHGPAQPGVLLAERRDRGLLAPRSPQGCTKLSSLVGRQLRQRRPDRAKLGKPRLQFVFLGLGHVQSNAQPVALAGQGFHRVLLVAQSPQFRNETNDLAVLRSDRLLVGFRALQILAQLTDLVLQQPGLLRPGLRHLQSLAQLVDLRERHNRGAAWRLRCGIPKAAAQTASLPPSTIARPSPRDAVPSPRRGTPPACPDSCRAAT